MKEVILTNKEKINLENELKKYKSQTPRQIKFYLTIIVVGTIIGGIPAYLNSENNSAEFLIEILVIFASMLIPLVIAFLISRKGIKKLTSDLKTGKKLKGNQQ